MIMFLLTHLATQFLFDIRPSHVTFGIPRALEDNGGL